MDELLHGLRAIAAYIAVCLCVAIPIRVLTRIEKEVFRKLLHGILLGALFVWISVFDTWWLAAAVCAGIVVALYPVLYLMERLSGYSEFFTERRTGELKDSLVQVFGMFALVIAVCWGLFGDKLLVLASVYAWGFGDAAAALVGVRFGRHRINLKAVGGKKSVEGTMAMFAVSFVSVLAVLLLRGGLHGALCAVAALITAAVSAAVELFTKNGHDTVTCPLAAMATLLAFLFAVGGL